MPPEDRVRSYAAEGVQVIGSADHDFIFDYAPLIARMGLVGRIASIVGTEVTTVRPLGTWSSGVGHFNGWPVAPAPQRRKNGAPEDEQNEPNVLYDRLRAIGAQVVQMNHPFSPGQGFLGIIGFDPAQRVDVPPNDALLHASALGTGTTNLDFDAIEIYNGLGQPNFDAARDAWFSLLSQGHPQDRHGELRLARRLAVGARPGTGDAAQLRRVRRRRSRELRHRRVRRGPEGGSGVRHARDRCST